ncbi:thiamine pyrophosphokinase, partial [Haematococcus lacustris]
GTRVCADGGANRLHDELPLLLPEEPAEQVLARHLPDLVLGDMDSLRPPVRDFFTTRGVCVRPSDDQDTTDLHKCLAYVQQEMQLKRDRRRGGEEQAVSGPSPASGSAAPQVPGGLDPSPAPPDHLVLVLGALGGRLDHTLGNLAVLHSFPNLNLVLLGEGNMVRLVPPGLTLIMPNKQVEGPHCGLIPIAGPARVTFSGLRWNLDNAVMQVGGLVSTSNLLQWLR